LDCIYSTKNTPRPRSTLRKQKETLNARTQVAPIFFYNYFFNQFEKNGELDRIGPRPDENFTVEPAGLVEFRRHWVPHIEKFEFVKLKIKFQIYANFENTFHPPPGPDGRYASCRRATIALSEIFKFRIYDPAKSEFSRSDNLFFG